MRADGKDGRNDMGALIWKWSKLSDMAPDMDHDSWLIWLL